MAYSRIASHHGREMTLTIDPRYYDAVIFRLQGAVGDSMIALVRKLRDTGLRVAVLRNRTSQTRLLCGTPRSGWMRLPNAPLSLRTPKLGWMPAAAPDSHSSSVSTAPGPTNCAEAVRTRW